MCKNEKIVSAEDAFNLIQDGVSVVSAGGYIYAKDSYFSYGTYPDCLRGGGVSTLKNMKGISGTWKVLTDKDIVLKVGYRRNIWNRPIRVDGTVNFDSLAKYLENNLTVTDYVNPIKNVKMVKKYFEGDVCVN